MEEYKKVRIGIYEYFNGLHLGIDDVEYTFNAGEEHYRLSGLVVCSNLEIKKYEEFIAKLTHDERLRFFNSLAESFKQRCPKLCVADWLIEKIEEEEAESFIDEFEYKGKENETTIAELKEELNTAKQQIANLERDLQNSKNWIESLIAQKNLLEQKDKFKLTYKGNGINQSIDLSLRERVVIHYGIMLQAKGKREGAISSNLKRLIANSETVTKYLKLLKSDGERPLSDIEKDNVRKFYEVEELDTGVIWDYLS